MKLRMFQIDAFTTELFAGNPAAVCPLESWLDSGRMQAIAAENNLSETAFFVPTTDGYDLRWFTPTTEVELCGHATLASAFVVFNYLGNASGTIRFNTRSGPLMVCQKDGLISMNFPMRTPEACNEPPSDLLRGLGGTPAQILEYGESENSGYYVAVFETEDEVRRLTPMINLLAQLGGMAVIVTAAGENTDFVSRCFAPSFGIDEDPVTGSAHCVLAPYWGRQSGKQRLHALQVSARGGEIFCELHEDRVFIAGHAVCYLDGTIDV